MRHLLPIFALGLTLTLLKSTDLIDLSWLWVLAPFWGPYVLAEFLRHVFGEPKPAARRRPAARKAAPKNRRRPVTP